jgi:ketosteroid isomerase-like protein
MSQENVEIVQQVFELFHHRDWDRLADLLDPNVEQHGTVGGVEEGNVARGIRQVRDIWEKEDDEIWDEHRFEPQQFIDAGDRVVVFQREYQRGKSSGVELIVDTASILDLRGGRIVRMQGYMDRGAALRAADLSEQATHADRDLRPSHEEAQLEHEA